MKMDEGGNGGAERERGCITLAEGGREKALE